MSHTPHELADDFPHATAKIHALKQADPHFARLMATYHKVNRTVHRTETGLEPVDDFTAQRLRKERMSLKDEIATILSRSSAEPEATER